MLWQQFFQPTTLSAALELVDRYAGQARLVSGATDLLVELQRGVRPTEALIDLSQIQELRYIQQSNGIFQIGAGTTHNDLVAHPAASTALLPLAQACWEVGAPQIRARATIVGNLVTASPANDTITPCMALGAEVVLTSLHGERVVPLADFYTGVRRTVLQPNELVRELRCAGLNPNQRGIFLKLGLRRAQAISVINLALVLQFEAGPESLISAAQITLGSVAPTIIHASAAEAYLIGKQLTPAVCAEAAQLVRNAARPIDDVRGSARYREQALERLAADALQRLATGQERQGWPDQVVRLEQPPLPTGTPPHNPHQPLDSIQALVNGAPVSFPATPGVSLLDALRDYTGLTGAKEGCAEGECGACTVWLNGAAVMACLVPSGQANGATITTIEGLANGHTLHPLQQAFIDHAAVQCGFCIPGMIMAGAKLLEEFPQPTIDQIQTALSGNICRCTGYRKIIQAVQAAANQEAS